MAPIVNVRYEAKQFYGSITDDLVDGRELVFHYDLSGSPMRAIELLEDQDTNGFEFRSKTRSPIHHLISQGPFSRCSFPMVVPLLVANSHLLLVSKLDIHVDVGYVLGEFCEIYFEDSVD